MNPTLRLRLYRQGFIGFHDAALTEFGPWLRLAPALCGLMALTGTLLHSWIVLWALAPAGVYAAITRKHPFDLLYDLGIRRLLKRREPLPGYRAPRRFASALGSAGVFAAGLAFFLGYPRTGAMLGASFAVGMLLAAATHYSLGSEIYRLVMPVHGPRSPVVREAVTVMLKPRKSISAPHEALVRRPGLRRTG